MIGTPTSQEIKNSKIVDPGYIEFLSGLDKKQPKDLSKVLKKVKDKDALDLIKKMLLFDFTKRITIDEALKHPYLKD